MTHQFPCTEVQSTPGCMSQAAGGVLLNGLSDSGFALAVDPEGEDGQSNQSHGDWFGSSRRIRSRSSV